MTNIHSAFDVIAIGNALVDILAHVSDEDIATYNMQKGSMQLVDHSRIDYLLEHLPVEIARSGGSAANTVSGIAALGGTAAFIGKTADDKLGHTFRDDLHQQDILFTTDAEEGNEGTGCCVVAITPDAERTMNTHLGIAPAIAANDIDATLIAQSSILYLEGYLWDREDTKHALRKAMTIAKQQGKEIAFTLSDSFCVERHRAEFLELIHEYVTILFANEQEIIHLCQQSTLDACINRVRTLTPLAALTRGNNGSLIVTEHSTHAIDAIQGIDVVDTTGAGDLYASGFLYGYTQKLALEACGKLASETAAKVIQRIGGRIE